MSHKNFISNLQRTWKTEETKHTKVQERRRGGGGSYKRVCSASCTRGMTRKRS